MKCRALKKRPIFVMVDDGFATLANGQLLHIRIRRELTWQNAW